MSTRIKIGIPQFNPGNDMLTTPLYAKLKADIPDRNAFIESDFSELKLWVGSASQEAIDFMILSFCIYGADRLIPRRRYSVDGWSRELEVLIPVVKLQKWNQVQNEISALLSFLTGDYWRITFYKNTMGAFPKTEGMENKYKQSLSQVNLFSGGLDSLIGAIDLMESQKKPALFISHYDPNMHGPKKDQNELAPEMIKKYGTRFIHIPSIKVFVRKDRKEGETTSRSRSIVFIGLANLFADGLKIDICVPENGTVSVNYPLSPSRRGACSTRTTHPTFIGMLSNIFNKVGLTSKIFNLYSFKTKGEMVKGCKNSPFLKQILDKSNSCGKRGHRAHWDKPRIADANHCGICMPCIYRRSALNGLIDNTHYGNDINKLNFITKKGQDVCALLEFIKSNVSKEDIRFELISNGLKDIDHIIDYIELVDRSRKELMNWIKKNGNIAVKRKAGL
jgi:7-cyano-7-deazaguanine synthase in queuosine biosynthesis